MGNGGAARGHGRSPDAHAQKGRFNRKMFAYVRLCSLMFAYVRLMGEKMLRALRTTGAEWWKTRRFQMSHGETFDIPPHRNRLRKSKSQDPGFVRQPIEWGSPGRSLSQSQDAASVSQPVRSNQTRPNKP